MFNEYEQGIIITAAIVLVILVVYFILKRNSVPQAHSNVSEKNDSPEVSIEEKVETVPEISEEPTIEQVSETSLYGTEEGDFGVITPTPDDKTLTDRRKNDKTIQKRYVPEHGKITKQNFSEFAGERILVAEDNIINQKVLLGLLAGSGIELVMADDGQEA
ncbi:MAG: response regulator, partial [Sulfuricurvum sp.]|nr:response regulator [Sulfuricurvum sp.]